MNCKRCKKYVENEEICQSCKNDLLFFYEATSDWTMALDLEAAQKSFFRFKNFGEDNTNLGF